MNPPKISIIVPVYKSELYIRKCVDSILQQTFSDFECILVNDCSPDNCGKICDEYANNDNRIKVIHKQFNEGLPQARKTGFLNSSGKYLLNVDSDDYIENTMLENMYLKITGESLDLLYCDYYNHNKENEIQIIGLNDFSDNFEDNIKIFIFDMDAKSYIWNKLVKRDIYNNLNFLTYGCFEDKYISTQLFFYSKKIGHLKEPLYHYIYNSSSILNSQNKKIKKHNEMKNNINSILLFIKENYNNDLSIFDPELTIRLNWLKKRNPLSPLNIVKNAIKIIIPKKIINSVKGIYNTKSDE